MRRTGLSKPSVWRWQERYLEAGVDGLLRDRTRPSRIPALSPATVADVIRRTLDERPPGEATHWTVRAMAEASGISPAKVHEIWQVRAEELASEGEDEPIIGKGELPACGCHCGGLSRQGRCP